MNEVDQPLTKKQRRQLKRQEKFANRQQQTKRQKIKSLAVWLSAGLIIGLTVLAIVIFGGSKNSADVSVLLDPPTDQDWSTGSKDAKYTLLEYSDFQCPACAAYVPTIKKLISQYGQDLRLVYRHFPLPYHQSSQAAALAAEAAGAQGKFFDMYEKLFASQTQWASSGQEDSYFAAYAKELNLNTDKFKNDYTSSTLVQKIESNYQSGLKNKLQATPTFYLNGQKISPQNPGELEYIVSQALKK